MLQPNKNISGTLRGKAISPHIEIRWDYALCMEKFRGMGLKPFVIFFFNPPGLSQGE
jgi:hypothetical protein